MNDSLTRRLTAMFGNANYAVTVNSSDLSDEELDEAYSSTVGDFHLDQIAGIEGVDGIRASVETGQPAFPRETAPSAARSSPPRHRRTCSP